LKQNFLTLDGMRGIAAIFVLIFHTSSYWGGFTFYHSYLAVDMFFLLSGFVIGHAYEDKLNRGTITTKDFVLIRLVRLYPMYFIAGFFALVVFLFKYLFDQSEASNYLSSLISSYVLMVFFLPSSLAGGIYFFPLNGPCWSIFYELIINFIYAFFRLKLNNKTILSIIFMLACLMVGLAFLHGKLDAGNTWRYTSIAAGLTRSGFGIFLGIYLNRGGKNFCQNLILPSWIVIILMSLVLMMPDLKSINGLFDLCAVFLIFPFCLVVAARCKSGEFMGTVFKLLGQASYPVYLLHVPISSLFYILGFGLLIERYAPLSGISLIIFLIYFSIQLEKIYDLPTRKYLISRLIKKA